MTAYAIVGEGFSFTEAPRWHKGALWFSDFYSERVMSFDGATFATECEIAGRPSGLGFAPNGDLLVVSMAHRRLLRRTANGSVDVVAELSSHFPGTANDMWVDSSGRAYIGNDGPVDPLEPTVLAMCELDGTVSIAASGVVTPNGVVISPDQRTLLLAETFAGRISAWDIGDNGALHDRRTWANFGSPELSSSTTTARSRNLMLPDGVALDAEHHLWVADAAGTGVWRLAEGGRIVDHVDTAPFTAYSIVLGGDDGRTMFITAGPRLENVIEADVPQAVILRARVAVPSAEHRVG